MAAMPAGAAPVGGLAPASATVAHRGAQAAGTPFCRQLGKRYQASSAAQMLCLGSVGTPQQIRSAAGARRGHTPANVDAASLREDVTAAGVRAYGQSEVSVAGAGRYVVEGWNDATSFFANCPSASAKEEATGLGFSANGGRSFTDLGGLPNARCGKGIYEGDPSVSAYQVAGRTYFYITSLFGSPSGSSLTHIAMAACQAHGSGRSARLSCSQPIMVASSSVCVHPKHSPRFCEFLDKDFAAIDPAHGRLYVSYSSFSVKGHATDNVNLAACDLGSHSGGPGPLGGTPASPVCASSGTLTTTAAPYLTIAHGDSQGCEDEGAYPAVDPATGAVYVGYEFNWFTNTMTGSPCASMPTRNVLTEVPMRCLPLSSASPCSGPTAQSAAAVTSMDAAFVPGYNRFPTSDFPRVAVSHRAGTVSMVWNDSRRNPLGDVLLQSYRLGSLRQVQRRPVVLSAGSRGLNFLPAVRTATAGGRLDVSWYARTSPTTAVTDVVAALGVNPRSSHAPRRWVVVTSVGSNWDNVSSDITPNFGDYTDASVIATGRAPYVGRYLYVAWSDGRLGVPQPFVARLRVR